MRTRNRCRNFGEDITNLQIGDESLGSIRRDRQKPCKTGQGASSDADKKSFQSQGKKLQGCCISEEDLHDILGFGCRYFEEIVGSRQYIGVQKQAASSQKAPSQLSTTQSQSMFASSPQLTPNMRNILVQWLIQVHLRMQFRYQSLFLTIFLVDKYSSRRNVTKANYQLLGIAALFIAVKFEEIKTPKMSQIIKLCDRLYNCSDVLRMESEILLFLNFQISQPSLNWFVGASLFFSEYFPEEKAGVGPILWKKFRKVCYYTLELCLFDLRILTGFAPQVIASTILYTTSMHNQFIGIDIKASTKCLNPSELRSMRECSLHMRSVFDNRLDKKYQVVNTKYPELFPSRDEA